MRLSHPFIFPAVGVGDFSFIGAVLNRYGFGGVESKKYIIVGIPYWVVWRRRQTPDHRVFFFRGVPHVSRGDPVDSGGRSGPRSGAADSVDRMSDESRRHPGSLPLWVVVVVVVVVVIAHPFLPPPSSSSSSSPE